MKQGTYELKYCERCGSLGTRRAHSSDTYCESCAQILTHSLLPGIANRRPRLRGAGKQKALPLEIKGAAEPACGRLQ
jgi:hypothetical protein